MNLRGCKVMNCVTQQIGTCMQNSFLDGTMSKCSWLWLLWNFLPTTLWKECFLFCYLQKGIHSNVKSKQLLQEKVGANYRDPKFMRYGRASEFCKKMWFITLPWIIQSIVVNIAKYSVFVNSSFPFPKTVFNRSVSHQKFVKFKEFFTTFLWTCALNELYL